MDIDVAEQLFPNILTIVTQLCATLILFLFAKKFLWNIARNILSERQEKMQSGFDEANRLQEEALKQKEEASLEYQKSQEKAKQMIDNAKKEANSEKQRILDSAKQEANAKLEKAEQSIEKKKQEYRNDLQQEIVDVALAASAKLMNETDLSSIDKESLSEFVKEIESE